MKLDRPSVPRRSRNYNPTPAEIVSQCRAIRDRWTPREFRRRGGPAPLRHFTVQEYNLRELQQLVVYETTMAGGEVSSV